MVKGEREIAGRDSRLALQGDFMEMFTPSLEWRLEPVPLFRFAGNLHQVWSQLQVSGMRVASHPFPWLL